MPVTSPMLTRHSSLMSAKPIPPEPPSPNMPNDFDADSGAPPPSRSRIRASRLVSDSRAISAIPKVANNFRTIG